MNFTLRCSLLIFSFLWISHIGEAQESLKNSPILAHSHNDYEQDYPLYTALAENFNSIEVDIVRVDDRLIVSHSENKRDFKGELEWMYLEPLKLHIESFQNWKYNNDSITRYLFLDLKKSDNRTLELLHHKLLKYEELLMRKDSLDNWKPLQIILTGDLNRSDILYNLNYPFFFVDGRHEDLKALYDSRLMPFISINYKDHSKWKGFGRLKREESRAIYPFIVKTLEQGKRIRFWGTADNEVVWKTLLGLKVDVIGVDDIERFMKFLRDQKLAQ